MPDIPIIDNTGLVVNVVALADNGYWTPDEGLTLGPPGGSIGDTWDGEKYVSPAVETPPLEVPQSVTPYQARKALNDAGLRSLVEAAVSAASQDVQDAWQYGISVERSSPMIVALAGSLGMTSEQVDALFIAAAAVG